MLKKFDMLAESILANGIKKDMFKEAKAKSLGEDLNEVIDEIEDEAFSPERKRLVKSILKEISMSAANVGKLMEAFKAAMKDEEFVAKYEKIRGAVDLEDSRLVALVPKVAKFLTSPDKSSRMSLKNTVVRLFADANDEEVRKVVEAEKAIIKMVKKYAKID